MSKTDKSDLDRLFKIADDNYNRLMIGVEMLQKSNSELSERVKILEHTVYKRGESLVSLHQNYEKVNRFIESLETAEDEAAEFLGIKETLFKSMLYTFNDIGGIELMDFAVDSHQKPPLETWYNAPNDIEEMKRQFNAAVMGLAGESGEVADLIKKWLFKPGYKLDRDKLINELGDVWYYLRILTILTGVSIDELTELNAEKLKGGHGWKSNPVECPACGKGAEVDVNTGATSPNESHFTVCKNCNYVSDPHEYKSPCFCTVCKHDSITIETDTVMSDGEYELRYYGQCRNLTCNQRTESFILESVLIDSLKLYTCRDCKKDTMIIATNGDFVNGDCSACGYKTRSFKRIDTLIHLLKLA